MSAEQASRKSPGLILFSEWLLFEQFGTVLGQSGGCRVRRHHGELSHGDLRETWPILAGEGPPRTGLPPQTRTFDNKTQAQLWARSVESEIDKGIVVDRR